MKSKTKISKQLKRKTSGELAETIILSKKNDAWKSVAGLLSGPRSRRIVFNLDEINKTAKQGETIVIPGKILSQGELDKKIKLVALAFSEKSKDKILRSKGEISNILDEIKNNPNGKGIRILTGR